MTPGRDLGNGWFERKTLDQATYYFHAHTGKLQWDMPEEPDGSSGTDSGDYAFLPDADEGWLPVRSLGGRFQSINGGEVRASAAAFARALPLRLSWLADKWLVQANDLVLLPEIHDGLVLESLRRRFHKQHIYTAVGPILVAINPFQLFPTLYGTEAIHKYRTRGNRDLPPHPYLTAAAAYQQLLEGCVPQSILVSGESGAGKTETTKHCLSFLAAVAGPSSAASSGSGVEAKLLSVNPILEAFGNAKTARNDNSSRFGRLTELWFSNDFRISGATITNYLLEKARASGPTPGERNFHSFYQVASSSQASRFGVDTNFSLLGSCATAHGIDDISDAAEVEEAFSVLGLSHDEFEMVLGAVAAVLHLGELSFKRDDSSDHDGAVLNHCSEVHAQWAARLLGVNDDDGVSCVQLKRALLSKTSQFGSEAVAVPLRHDQACESRDALARLVYGRLFDWLVTKVNIHLAALDVMAARSIGILDIFGFEVFKANGFNQLCINFANEKVRRARSLLSQLGAL
jgi:myosin heavy subunit